MTFSTQLGGYYDDKGQWQRLKDCFIFCGAACDCMPPGGLDYSEAHDKSKTPAVPAPEASTTDEKPSAVRIAHAQARHTCELCHVKNFAIGGRTKGGNFYPLFQPHPDAAAARLQIGKRAWCGNGEPTYLLKVFRVICKAVHIGRDPTVTLLLCERCINAMKEQTVVEVAA